MSRPLSPFVRHLGEAKYRGRLLQAALDQVQAAAVSVAGLTSGREDLSRAIAVARQQLDLLEAKAAEWGAAPPAMPARSARTRDQIGEFLDRRQRG